MSDWEEQADQQQQQQQQPQAAVSQNSTSSPPVASVTNKFSKFSLNAPKFGVDAPAFTVPQPASASPTSATTPAPAPVKEPETTAPTAPTAATPTADTASPAAAPKKVATENEPVTSSPVQKQPKSSSTAPQLAEVEEDELAEALEELDIQETEEEEDTVPRKHINIVFIGHVDAGKSTISGHLLYLTGYLDDRTLEKFEREAKNKNRESWKWAWALDLTDTEREKGKTEEVGKAAFNTITKRVTILDAPGHKSFVPHMIGGAAQADIGILVISARKGELEAGLERGGQTKEHAMLAKTVGVRQLIVVINKMDDETVEWEQARYDECVSKLTVFLKQTGYNPKTDITFIPTSGMTGLGLKDRIPKEVCPWWSGPSLLEVLEFARPPERLLSDKVRLPITDKYREMGVAVLGKLESGVISKGDKLMVMPTGAKCEVANVYLENHEIKKAEPGDNIKLKLKGLEEDDVHVGFVLCQINQPCQAVRLFDCQINILETKSIITAGYSCVLHAHAVQEECSIEKLIAKMDRRTNQVAQRFPKFAKAGDAIRCRISVAQPICLETFKDFQSMGRFMLRDEGKTVAVGVVMKLVADTAASSSSQ